MSAVSVSPTRATPSMVGAPVALVLGGGPGMAVPAPLASVLPSSVHTAPAASQAARRAIRTLGSPTEHRTAFIATEGELLAGDAQAPVWQQCGAGNNAFLPEAINPDVSLDDIMSGLRRRTENAAASRRKQGLEPDDHPVPAPVAVPQRPAGDDAPALGAGRWRRLPTGI